MRRTFRLSLSIIALVSFLSSNALAGSGKSLATITGTVVDNHGNPLAGALVTLVREGAKVVKHTTTDRYGNFIAKVLPGRYGIKANANGFAEVAFNDVDVKAQQELVYRFNLEPVGYGNTLPERRRDRDDVKWKLRAAQQKRSIFQVQEGEDSAIKAVTASEEQAEQATDTAQMETAPAPTAETGSRLRPHGVMESYFASNAYGSSYVGLNFAVAAPISEHVELIFAGQTGTGEAPQRFEASTRFRAANR